MLKVSEAHLLGSIEALAAVGAIEGGGNARLALTDEDKTGRDLVVGWMRALGLDVRIDAIGNVIGMRGGRENDATFGRRMTGSGPYAWMIGRRFELACRRLGLNDRKITLAADRFRRPPQPGEQLTLL